MYKWYKYSSQNTDSILQFLEKLSKNGVQHSDVKTANTSNYTIIVYYYNDKEL